VKIFARDGIEHAEDHRQTEGGWWVEIGGAKHDKFEHPERPETLIIVPRHREQSPGVARDIAKRAGWM